MVWDSNRGTTSGINTTYTEWCFEVAFCRYLEDSIFHKPKLGQLILYSFLFYISVLQNLDLLFGLQVGYIALCWNILQKQTYFCLKSGPLDTDQGPKINRSFFNTVRPHLSFECKTLQDYEDKKASGSPRCFSSDPMLKINRRDRP